MGCQAPNVDKAPPRVRMAMVIRLVTDNMLIKLSKVRAGCQVAHSYRKATAGSTRVALRAGR